MTNQEFIETIAPIMVKYAKQYGYKIVSAAIAQACLESGYGTSPKAKHHNYFGLKYRKNRVTCNQGYFEDGGSEQNSDGTYTPLPSDTAWYNFPTMEAGCEGYYQFINIAPYAKVKTATTPIQYLQEIKNAHYATSINYVANVNAVVVKWGLNKYDQMLKSSEVQTKVANNNSSLVDYTKLSPNNSGKRTHTIDRITPHCIVGQWEASTIGNYFSNPTVKASCNYGIAKDGKVVLVVEEDKRSWCSSSNENDQRAVTIECASDVSAPYVFNDAVYNKLIELCVDICKRNHKNKLLWIANKDEALKYKTKENEMLLTVHRWFKQKACPGDWLMARMDKLAAAVTQRLGGSLNVTTQIQETKTAIPADPYIVQITASNLNIRKGPGINFPIVGVIRDKGKYTIMEEQAGFGLLKAYSGNRNGWISLKYTQKI